MWALVIDNKVVELTDVDPSGRYHESLQWNEVAVSVEVGFEYEGGQYKPPKENIVVPSNEEIEILRLEAYADPVSGSDRYFVEAMSMQAEGFPATSEEVKEAKVKGLARKAEIQALYPWSVE